MKALVGVAISVALLGYLVWSVDVRDLGEQLARTRWEWVVVASVLGPVCVWARGRRWWYLFPPHSEPPALVPATMIGYMVNNILPLRAGEFVRVYVVARRWGHGFWTALATLIVERVLDSLVIVLVMVVLVLHITVPRPLEIGAAVLLGVDLVAVSVLCFLAIAPERARGLIERLTRRRPSLQRRVVGILETFVRGLEGVRTRAHLGPLAAWTVLIWGLPAVITWSMFRALDLDVPWIAAWVVLAFVGLGVAIPSAPGYIGVFHAAATIALTIFGVPATAAFGYALLFHATQILPITAVGWIYLLREHVSLTEATRREASASELLS
ncbi:MAG TPA: lysylphosphatidylglycerol synthase transmembrane domain-containing protein [Candidatus Acidoferrum sp.]|nr:lysylphosphatidylglycerol synthase transmembrane domain-containing protein [Candidatus Acidoferrum sp.]